MTELSRQELEAEVARLRKQVVVLKVQVEAANFLQEALSKHEGRFRALLEDVRMVAVHGYDRNRRVTFWNRASEEMYGYSRDEALGQKLEDLIIPAGMREEVIAGMNRWMEEGVPVPAAHLELRRKDGSPVHVYSSHVMQENISGAREMFCVDVDFTEVRQAQEHLHQAKEVAEAASKAKSVFLANMSHEIRTPLNGILGMLQLLRETALSDEQTEYLDAALSASRRLTCLVSDILDLSRMEADTLGIRSSDFSLNEIQAAVQEMYSLTAREKGLDFTTNFAADLPPVLTGDGIRVRQILCNLVGNAIKFTSSGQVCLDVSSLGQDRQGRLRVLFCVQDSGPGIPDDRLQDIFKPFVQVDSSFVRQYEGAGLGLTIVQRLVERMGGTMSVDTSAQGTLVCWVLPLQVKESETDNRQVAH